jgi:hypothetical protein
LHRGLALAPVLAPPLVLVLVLMLMLMLALVLVLAWLVLKQVWSCSFWVDLVVSLIGYYLSRFGLWRTAASGGLAFVSFSSLQRLAHYRRIYQASDSRATRILAKAKRQLAASEKLKVES